MQKPKKSNKTGSDKPIINLPAQKVWHELEAYDAESLQGESSSKDCKNLNTLERLLDQAFELLLEKIIRQS